MYIITPNSNLSHHKLKNKKFIRWLLCSLLVSLCIIFSGMAMAFEPNNVPIYLYKPTGKFNVGFEDFHWINDEICPDPAASGEYKKYFSQGNKKFCREMMVRVYYPTSDTQDISSPYSAYMLSSFKQRLLAIKQPELAAYIDAHMEELSKIQMYARAKATIANGLFPVIIFSSGAVNNDQEYTNLLINLSSHGYIVVAINGSFLTTVTFSDGRIVPANTNLLVAQNITTLYRMKYLDMDFVFHKIISMHTNNSIFKHVNLDRIGLLGHSAGASATVAMARSYPNKIKAAVALDAPNQTDPNSNPNLRKANISFPRVFDIFHGFKVPFMQIHSSNAEYFFGAPNKEFQFFPNNFLVTITPTPYNENYFKHMDYSDYALFKDLPFMKKINEYYNKKHLENPIFPGRGYGSVSGHVAIKTVSDQILIFYNAYLLEQPSQSLKNCTSLTDNTIMVCK